MQDSIDTSTPTGRFTFAVIAAVAELEREIIRERTKCGLEAARRRGAKIGRPRVRVDLDEARRLIDSGVSVRRTAQKLKCGASTLTRALRGVSAPAPPTEFGQDADSLLAARRFRLTSPPRRPH